MPYLLIFIGCLGITISIVGLNNPYIQHFDIASLAWMDGHRTPFSNGINVFLSHIGGLPSMLIICSLWCITLYQSKQFTQILFISFSLLGGSALGWFLKWFFDRARPDAIYALTETYGASFPSAHSIYATVLSCLIIFIFHKHAYARIILFLACLWFLGMGISRVYLGAHYPTDVLAGWSIALIWVSCLWLYFSPLQISKNKLFLEKNLNEVE